MSCQPADHEAVLGSVKRGATAPAMSLMAGDWDSPLLFSESTLLARPNSPDHYMLLPESPYWRAHGDAGLLALTLPVISRLVPQVAFADSHDVNRHRQVAKPPPIAQSSKSVAVEGSGTLRVVPGYSANPILSMENCDGSPSTVPV